MRSTVDGLIASQYAGGLFPYGYDFITDRPLEPDRTSPSNLIRQAGTASALAAYYRHTRDARAREPLERILFAFGRYSLPVGKSRAQHWIEQTHVLSIGFARQTLHTLLQRSGMLYEPAGDGRVVSGDGQYDSALAGTVALALLAESTYAHASADNRFAAFRAAWIRGLLDLRIPGGGFRKTPTSIDESNFYNGEGWLAVAVYSDLHPDDADAATALVALDRVMLDRYSQRPESSFYHWGAMAAAQRYATTREPRFLAFLRNQAEVFLTVLLSRHDAEGNHCAEMEGAAATLEALDHSGEGEGALARRLRTWLSTEALKLPRLQIQPGQTGLTLGGDAELRAPKMGQFAGAFLKGFRDPSTRVDLAQHCLSAMVILDRDRLEFPPR